MTIGNLNDFSSEPEIFKCFKSNAPIFAKYPMSMAINTGFELRTVQATRYITPLREGGSLPAIMEADDGFMYVVKFRGAGQGVKSLIAEIIGSGIAKALGIKIPELVFVTLDESFGRSEPDEEIQDLLKASTGLNLGMHFLSGALTFDPLITTVEPAIAAPIVWMDNLIQNVDRTAKNTNLLLWKGEIWMIDNGASLYFHHSWDNYLQAATKPFAQIKDHVLLAQADNLSATDADLSQKLDTAIFTEIVAQVPDEWLLIDAPFIDVAAHRQAYVEFLTKRLAVSAELTKHAIHARTTLI